MTNSRARTEGRATVLNNDEPSQPEGQQGDKNLSMQVTND